MPQPKYILLAIIILISIWPGVSPAANDNPQPAPQIITGPSLADLITTAYTKNPDILAAKAEWQAEIELYRITTAYPDPQLMVTYFNEPIETRLGPQDWSANLSQKIPFPGKLSKAGEMVTADIRIARLNLDKTVRDTITDLRLAFHELFYISKAREIALENSKLLEQIRKQGETAYAEDKAALIDVVKAQSQTAQLQYDQLLLAELAQTEKAKINAILDRPPDAAIGILVPEPIKELTYSLEEIYRLAEINQEEIKIAQENINKAEAGKDLATYQALPDFTVGLFYAGIGEPDTASKPINAGQDAMGIQAGMNIPLWYSKSSGQINQAKAKLSKAKEMKSARLNKTKANISQVYFRLNNAGRLIKLYSESLLPQATAAISTAETWYREGQGSFSDFIETQATVYNFQLSLARAQADYGKYLAKLEGLTGRKLTTAPAEAQR
ncbi:MAG: TolC family protein [Proteobacteria bacterium]|nr:TolC family protein [Pseudomonadota bacterium]MBU1715427.1 TolC family protein [Pseudomonadota bacterium]